jgi:hypothetical protein
MEPETDRPRPVASEITHVDLYLQIGEMKGQLSALTVLVSQKREDLNNAFARIQALEQDTPAAKTVDDLGVRVRALETAMARWAGIALASSVAMPILIQILLHIAEPVLHLRQSKPTATTITRPWT